MNKNGKILLEKIADLDPELITNAEKRQRKSRLFIGITSGIAAAAAAVMIIAATAIIPAKDPFGKYKDLPKISEENYGGGAWGGRTRELYSWQLDHASLWNGAELETMPVFMSSSTETPDLDRMYTRMREIIAVLDIPEDSLTITDNYQRLLNSIEWQIRMVEESDAPQEKKNEEINRMTRGTMASVRVEAENDNIRISLSMDYRVWIVFNEPWELPEGYNFTKSASYEERANALNYLADKYKELTGYSNPQPGHADSWGSYIYESDGDLTQQIVNYWINTAGFEVDDNTGLSVIDICSDGALTKLADYPILTAAQAEQILKSGKYINEYGINQRMPADAKILKTDLIYRNLSGSVAVMPYYEFYVQTDEEPHNDYDVVCEVYSIPAVPEEFIDMDTADYGAHA